MTPYSLRAEQQRGFFQCAHAFNVEQNIDAVGFCLSLQSNSAAKMSNDTDESDDDADCIENNSKRFKEPSLPDHCQDEVHGIACISACFMRRYNACPMFYPGSLLSTCQQAFISADIKERRPVLVYVHNDWSAFTHIFCSNIFCTEVVIDYLLQNYLVWPWDVTHDCNREKYIKSSFRHPHRSIDICFERLSQCWQDVFPDQPLRCHSTEEYPLLIGISRPAAGEQCRPSSSEYQWKPLLRCNRLTRSEMPVTRATLLQELVNFNEECQAHEQTLSFDFGALTGLCPEVLLEILQYLSLNDAINAFSDTILPLLRECQTRVHLSLGNPTFANMVQGRLHPEQIFSLHLPTSPPWSDRHLSDLIKFTKLTSLTLVNPADAKTINEYTGYFPHLVCLSLFYDSEIAFMRIRQILVQIHKPLKRFEIHCVGAFCSHLHDFPRRSSVAPNLDVIYLLVEIGHLLLPLANRCCPRRQSCFLTTMINFISTMFSVRHVRLITEKGNLDQVLGWNEWTSLINERPQLRKITVETWRYTLCGERYVEKVMDICAASHRTKEILY